MIVFRSVFSELVSPFLLSCFVMSALLMMEKVYRLVNLVVSNRLRIQELWLMLIYLLPQILTITLPLAVVGAVFITAMRQSLDSELICLRATGRSLWSYSQPFVAFGVVSTAVTALFTLLIQPISYSRYTDLQLDMVRYRAEEKIIPGEFNYDFGSKVIRIGARLPDKQLSSIFIADRALAPNSAVITADHGRIDVDQESKKVVFRLEQGQIFVPDPNPEIFRTVDFGRMNYVLDFQPLDDVSVNSLWSMSTPALVDEIQVMPSESPNRTRDILELFFRITTPLACLAFSISALPLGILNPRTGRYGNFLRAILLVVIYYVIWIGSKDLAYGRVTSSAILLLPPASASLFGFYRLWMMNADLDSPLQLLVRPLARSLARPKPIAN